MIIFKVNFEGVFTLECKRDSPVAAYRNTPSASSIALQPMQAISRQVHICRATSAVKHVQLSAETVGKVSGHAALFARFKEPLESLMAKALYHAV